MMTSDIRNGFCRGVSNAVYRTVQKQTQTPEAAAEFIRHDTGAR